MTSSTIPASTFEAVAAAADFGQPSARKAGRYAHLPYVPVIMFGHQQHQVLGLAFATRAEALAAAERHVAAERAALAAKLADPRFRALREAHGLPRELVR